MTALEEKAGKPPRFNPSEAADLGGLVAQVIEWIRWSERQRMIDHLKEVERRLKEGTPASPSTSIPPHL